VEIRCDRAQPVQFDGDTVEPTDRLDLEIDPSSLTLAVPEHPPGPDPPVRKNSDLIACSGGHSRGHSTRPYWTEPDRTQRNAFPT
jgi:hypothetical protein